MVSANIQMPATTIRREARALSGSSHVTLMVPFSTPKKN
jgi:hypothetical protein